MQLAPRWIDRNLSRLELVIALVIIMTLIGVFTRRMLLVFARAERSMVERTVTNINTSLKYQAVFYQMRDDYRDLARLGNMNPMAAMQGYQVEEMLSEGAVNAEQVGSGFAGLIQPANYLGEFDAPEPDKLGKGVWYYDKDRRQLVYIIRNTEFFHSDIGGVPRLRFQVNVEYADRNGNGVFDPPADEYRSVHMASINHYKWTI